MQRLLRSPFDGTQGAYQRRPHQRGGQGGQKARIEFEQRPGIVVKADDLRLFPFQSSDKLVQAVTAEAALENLADDGSLIEVDRQLTICSNSIATAFALGHFGGVALDAFL